MSVVDIGIVDMAVIHRLVPMPVTMGFIHQPGVFMLMVVVVAVGVLVFESLVRVFVPVPFGEMQP